jgi:hypothetical protein
MKRTPDSRLTITIVRADESRALRRAVRRSLKAQGFRIEGNGVGFRQKRDKRSIRKRHALAVARKVVAAKPSIQKFEAQLIAHIASGTEINPQSIRPRLDLVEAGTWQSNLFRFASLHWSIPVSDGYGRRLRFLIFDDANNKLIGLLGLGDPVYSIRARDEWIGWDPKNKAQRLYHVMDAYVLGAVPPYSKLLGGKLIALAAACDEVREAFRNRYAGRRAILSGRERDPHLVLLTTTSALGRSSIYNRLKFRERLMFRSAGFTGGWGEFHFSDGVYEKLSDFAREHCEPTAKRKAWGKGFRNRRELVRKALAGLGYSEKMLNHGIQRELFVIPLARNTRAFLREETDAPLYYKMPFAKVARFWKKRWLLPRAERDNSWRVFKNSEWLLWAKGGK